MVAGTEGAQGVLGREVGEFVEFVNLFVDCRREECDTRWEWASKAAEDRGKPVP